VVAEGLVALARREWIPGKRLAASGRAVLRASAALELGRRIAAVAVTSSDPVCDPAVVAQRLIAVYAHRVQETFGGLFLDARNRIICEPEIYVGTLNSSTV
jgi:DNA repair protein RadC